MPLSKASTVADALNQYNDNLDWDGDAAKAKLALAAIRFLQANRPDNNIVNGRTFDFGALDAEKAKILQDLKVTDTSSNRATWTRGVMLTP